MIRTIHIPLAVNNGILQREEQLKQSIDNTLELLLTTPLGSCAADPDFGFVFNNMAFENFNENDGTIFNTLPVRDGFGEHYGLYNKKVSGSSKNISTFAADLRDAILKYERRLRNPTVTMTYMRLERSMHVLIRGELPQIDTLYEHKFVYKLWR
ncbi:MAG: hypothetical protein KBT12_02330 [Bacteroidales bacterium]|nr:hypothetical protein [Candidatus Physcousia equi]